MDEEIVARVVLAVAMAGAGALVVWMAVATASGRLRRNPVAGIRLASTMASDEAWLAAHVAARRSTLVAGWASMASAVPAILPVGMPVVLVSAGVGCVALLACTLHGARVGAAAARRVASGEP